MKLSANSVKVMEALLHFEEIDARREKEDTIRAHTEASRMTDDEKKQVVRLVEAGFFFLSEDWIAKNKKMTPESVIAAIDDLAWEGLISVEIGWEDARWYRIECDQVIRQQIKIHNIRILRSGGLIEECQLDEPAI